MRRTSNRRDAVATREDAPVDNLIPGAGECNDSTTTFGSRSDEFLFEPDGAISLPPNGEPREGEIFDRRHFGTEDGATAWIKEN